MAGGGTGRSCFLPATIWRRKYRHEGAMHCFEFDIDAYAHELFPTVQIHGSRLYPRYRRRRKTCAQSFGKWQSIRFGFISISVKSSNQKIFGFGEDMLSLPLIVALLRALYDEPAT